MTNETKHDALLTLAIPVSLEDDVLNFLLQHPQWASGFSMVDADGMGQGASLLSTMERVQGRARRTLVLVAGVEADLRELVAALGQEIRNRDVAWWIAPLVAFGRLQ
jgi:hypothetical protein